MKFRLAFLLLFLPIFAQAGAGPDFRRKAEKLAELTPETTLKAEAFRSAMKADGLRNGVYVYSATLKQYADAPEKLAARLCVLGFDDVYMSCNRKRLQEREEWTRRFVSECHSYGMRVQAMRMENLQMLVDHGRAKTEIDILADYNASVSKKERIDGISADIEVHIAKKARGYDFLPYVWDAPDSFGPGKDKDALLKLSIELFDYAYPLTGKAGLELSEALSCNFQGYYDKGQVEWGSTSQYLDRCDYAIMMAYYPTMESIFEKSEPALKDARREKCVSVALKTAMNSMKSASLQPQGWDYLLEALRYLNGKCSAYPSFRGIDIFHYQGLEEMWLI